MVFFLALIALPLHLSSSIFDYLRHSESKQIQLKCRNEFISVCHLQITIHIPYSTSFCVHQHQRLTKVMILVGFCRCHARRRLFPAFASTIFLEQCKHYLHHYVASVLAISVFCPYIPMKTGSHSRFSKQISIKDKDCKCSILPHTIPSTERSHYEHFYSVHRLCIAMHKFYIATIGDETCYGKVFVSNSAQEIMQVQIDIPFYN